MSDPGISTGEAGGMFAGLVAVLGVIGAAIRWVAGWQERRATSRAAKLQQWHDELIAKQRQLDEGGTAYTKRLEDRLAHIEAGEEARDAREIARDAQMAALRYALELVSAALRALDPHHRSLSQAEQVLAAAFPVKLATPPDMIATLGQIETAGRSTP